MCLRNFYVTIVMIFTHLFMWFKFTFSCDLRFKFCFEWMETIDAVVVVIAFDVISHDNLDKLFTERQCHFLPSPIIKRITIFVLWIVFSDVSFLYSFYMILYKQSSKSDCFVDLKKLFLVLCLCRKIYFIPFIWLYEGSNLWFSLCIFLNFFLWFSVTVIAYLKHLPSLVFGFIVWLIVFYPFRRIWVWSTTIQTYLMALIELSCRCGLSFWRWYSIDSLSSLSFLYLIHSSSKAPAILVDL